ncbi:MAG: NosD domain-containing protein, partial [Candidatus Thorarchaeota archaeon]
DCFLIGNEQTQYGISEDSVGFELMWSDRCTLANNSFSRNTYGLWMSCCLDLQVENNTFVENGLVLNGPEVAHYVIEESDNMVNGLPLGYFSFETERSIDASEFGQLILVECSDVLVENGHIQNATTGVLIAFCGRCNISSMTLEDNNFGISFEHTVDSQVRASWMINNRYGVFLSELSQEISIINNTICDNDQGISFASASACTVLDNVLVDNEQLGLGVGGSGSTICYNTFGRNGQNAVDQGYGNLWDNEVDCGNFWDDAVLGAVYVIPGEAGSVDRYPNGTAGTYTPTITTNPVWIGNNTLFTIPLELLVVAGASVGTVIIVAVIVHTRQGKIG